MPITKWGNKKLIRFLSDDLNIEWAKNAEIHKSNDDKIISITKAKDKKSAEMVMDDEKKEKAILKINDKRYLNLIVKGENYKLKIYKKRTHIIPHYLKKRWSRKAKW